MKLAIRNTRAYFEKYALCVLEDYNPQKYQGLAILDKPDLQDPNGVVGVEVTTADPLKELWAAAKFDKRRGTESKQKQKAIEEELKASGVTCSKGGLIFQNPDYNNTSVLNCIREKLERLNHIEDGERHYKPFPHYELFISVTSLDHPQKEVFNLEQLLDQMQSSFEHRFEIVFLFFHVGKMYVFDLERHSTSIVTISDEQYARYKRSATEYVNSVDAMIE